MSNRKRWSQFSLRGLLLVTFVMSYWLGSHVNASRDQRVARTHIAAIKGIVSTTYPLAGGDSKDVSQVSLWLQRNFGEDLFQPIQTLMLGQLVLEPGESAVVDEDLCSITKRLPKLKSVGLARTQITDLGLKSLCRLRRLETLFLYRNDAISTQGLASLSSLGKLRELMIFSETSADDAMEAISQCRSLRKLHVKFRNCTDTGLQHIAKLEQLEYLTISSSKQRTTDKGLAALSRLENLKEFTMSSTSGTPNGIRRLSRAIPDCKIQIHRNASTPRTDWTGIICRAAIRTETQKAELASPPGHE